MRKSTKRPNSPGFTLLEVLLALAIIAIAFAALLKANGQNIRLNTRLLSNTKQTIVAEQALRMIQLGIINPPEGRETTESMVLFNQRWYWRVLVEKSPINTILIIKISTSQKLSGPFTQAILGYRYKP